MNKIDFDAEFGTLCGKIYSNNDNFQYICAFCKIKFNKNKLFTAHVKNHLTNDTGAEIQQIKFEEPSPKTQLSEEEIESDTDNNFNTFKTENFSFPDDCGYNDFSTDLNSEEEEYCRLNDLKRKYSKNLFKLENSFKSLKEVDSFLELEGLWTKRKRNKTPTNQGIIIECKSIKNGQQEHEKKCPATIKLIRKRDIIEIYRSKNEHNCNLNFAVDSIKIENKLSTLNDKNESSFVVQLQNDENEEDSIDKKSCSNYDSNQDSNSAAADSEYEEKRTRNSKKRKKPGVKIKIKKESDEIDEDSMKLSTTRDESKRKYTKKAFKLEKVFKNINEAEVYIKSENSWSKKNRNKVSTGEVIFYRCRRVKRKYNEECTAMIKLVVEPDKVAFHRSEEDHNCAEIMKRNLSCDPKFKKLLEPYNIKHQQHFSSNDTDDVGANDSYRKKRFKKHKSDNLYQQQQQYSDSENENECRPSTSKRRKFVYSKELEAKLLAEVGSHVLPPSVKEEIERLFNQEKKPREIIAAVAANDFGVSIKDGQIRRFICKLQERRKYITRENLHAEMDEWIGNPELFKIPLNPNQPFISAYENTPEKTNLILFLTTKRLLFNALNMEIIQMDGNIKLKWQNYLIYPIGTTDSNGQFHNIGIFLCEMKKVRDFYHIFKILKQSCLDIFQTIINPKILLCSGIDKCIQLAFKKFFSSNDASSTSDINGYECEIKIRACYSFVRKQCRRKLDEIIPDQKIRICEVLEDLDFVQKSASLEEYSLRIDKFANRWALYVEFMTYFHQDWFDLGGMFQWYEGYTSDCSSNMTSQNDLLSESLKLISDDENYRARLPVNQFSTRIFEWIAKWSHNEYNIDLENHSPQTHLDRIEQERLLINGKVKQFMESQENDLYDSLSDESITTLIKKEYRRRYNFKDEHKQRQKPHREFIQDRVFSSKAEAEAVIASEKMWSFSNRSHTKAGTKLNYRCRVSRRTQTDCYAGVSLFLRSDCTDVILFRATAEHSCDGIPRKQHGIPETIRQEIDRLSELNMKPKTILQHLEQHQFQPLPTETQVLNYLTLQRERKYGAHNLDFTLLESWLVENYKTPDENMMNKMFIVAYEVSNNSEVRFLVSSRKLLQNAINIENIQIDNTHKLGWIKFPFFIIGTTDRWSKFHCLGLCICNSLEIEDFEFLFKSLRNAVLQLFKINIQPNILITDNTLNLQQGFLNIFGLNSKVKICNEHIKRMLKFKSKMIKNKDVRCGVLADLHVARKCATLEAFQISINQFLEKWPKYAPEFCRFFQQDYLSFNSFWYAGFEPNSPKSNVASEIFVKSIKNDETFRKKIPFNQFIVTLTKWVENWSHNG